jgi:predicted secreted acid phosphatase
MILDGTKYPEGWVSWGKEAAATEVPGAKNFLNYAASKGANNFLCYKSSGGVKRGNKKESNQPWYALGSNKRYCFNARRK